jgi:hypothetical protein
MSANSILTTLDGAFFIILSVAAYMDLKSREVANYLPLSIFLLAIFQMVINSEVNISGTANDVAIDRSITQTLPLTLQTDNFTIPRTQDIQSQYSLNISNNHSSLLESVTSTIRLNLLPFGVDALLLLLLFLLISANTIKKSKELKEHRRFKEWITEGSVDVKDKLSINILSLEGLVDLAIDLDKRVIFDPTVHKYYVLTEDLVYIYDSERSRALLENKEMLGKLLLKRGLITAEQLEMGLYYQKKNGIKLINTQIFTCLKIFSQYFLSLANNMQYILEKSILRNVLCRFGIQPIYILIADI